MGKEFGRAQNEDPLYDRIREEQRNGIIDPNKKSNRRGRQRTGAALTAFGLMAAACGEASGAIPSQKEPPVPAYVHKATPSWFDYGITVEPSATVFPTSAPQSPARTDIPISEQGKDVPSILEQLLNPEVITDVEIELNGVKYGVIELPEQAGGGGEGEPYDSAPTNFNQITGTINGEALISGLRVIKEGEEASLMMPIAIWDAEEEEWKSLTNSEVDIYQATTGVVLREEPKNGLGGRYKGSISEGETVAKVPGSETYARIYINGGYYDVVVIFDPKGTIGLDIKGELSLGNGIAYVASDFVESVGFFKPVSLQRVDLTQEAESTEIAPIATEAPPPAATPTPEPAQTPKKKDVLEDAQYTIYEKEGQNTIKLVGEKWSDQEIKDLENIFDWTFKNDRALNKRVFEGFQAFRKGAKSSPRIPGYCPGSLCTFAADSDASITVMVISDTKGFLHWDQNNRLSSLISAVSGLWHEVGRSVSRIEREHPKFALFQGVRTANGTRRTDQIAGTLGWLFLDRMEKEYGQGNAGLIASIKILKDHELAMIGLSPDTDLKPLLSKSDPFLDWVGIYK